jgi:hypothetical protein
MSGSNDDGRGNDVPVETHRTVPTRTWKSRPEREIPTFPPPMLLVVEEEEDKNELVDQ